MSSRSTRDIVGRTRQRVLPSGSKRRGLVIGIESYQDSRLNLRCARSDALTIYDLMVDPNCGAFEQNDVCLLLDDQATKENVWRALASLRRSATEDDTVWIYYAGHAAPEESHVYWVTHDADVDDLYGTGLANDQISRVLDDVRANRLVVFLDCCHAAATSVQKNPTRGVLKADDVFSVYKGNGHITLASSDGTEKSIELADVGHGAFTWYLQQGLRGEADLDGNGVVTADELWSYLRSKVTDASQQAGNRQTPILQGEMSHDLALTLNPVALNHQGQIQRAIHDLVGLGDDQLTTQEAELCLSLLCRPPANSPEQSVVDEMANATAGRLSIVTFKTLIQTAVDSQATAKTDQHRQEYPDSTSSSTRPFGHPTDGRGTASCVASTPHASDVRMAVLLTLGAAVVPFACSAFVWACGYLLAALLVGIPISTFDLVFGSDASVWGPVVSVGTCFGAFFAPFIAIFFFSAFSYRAFSLFPSGAVRGVAGGGLGVLLATVLMPAYVRVSAEIIDFVFEIERLILDDWSWVWISSVWPCLVGGVVGGVAAYCVAFNPRTRAKFDREGAGVFFDT